MAGSVSRGRPSTTGRTADSWQFVLDLGYDGAGKRRQLRRRGFPSRRAAQAALDAALADLARGQLAGPGRRTVGQYLISWLETVQMTLAPSGHTHYRTVARRYVVPRLGALQLSALTPLTLSLLYADLSRSGGRTGQPLAPATVRQVHKLLHKALKDAVLWGLLPANPAERATVPRPSRPVTEVWNPEQVARFLSTLEQDRMAACWTVAVTTGLRRGELAGVRWSDVDLDRAVLAVTQQRTTDSYGQVVLCEPKGRSRRRVDLGHGAVAALRRHRAQQNAERLAAGPAWQDSGLVFVHPDGAALYRQHITDLFYRATDAAACRASACTTCGTRPGP